MPKVGEHFKKRLGYLSFAIVLDAAANALMISSNMGSAVWMASGVNISSLIHVPYGTTLFVYAVLVSITNQILLRKFDAHIFISNLLFSLPFSYLVGFFTWAYKPLGFDQMNIVVRLIIDILGLIGVSAGTSIYQRCNLIQHPNDELAYLLRFKYLHGSAGWGQLFSYTPPVVIMIICFAITGNILSVGIGTILAMFIQGIIIGWSDKLIVPSLKHHLRIGKTN
ncbi:membrane protein [Companilactobacillus ginsenosidimutans]|uniref:Membrane protein n=1 Tax=Companilactobacillus ginsenosidimutans TaxID=1007676 RepID=A0A0H4QLX9_9LACO|nr:membrane protein [Companilactobacillus ginsenosidimutans]AKP68111.1 membrane protein [Companilactobacillus ginsenosidimutans]